MFRNLIIGVSVLVPLIVFLLYLFPAEPRQDLGWISFLPAFNASVNSITAILLVLARVAILKGNEGSHRNLMLTAFGFSGVFLISYLIYHSSAEPTSYGGEGLIKGLYYILLISHIILAALVLPLILFAIYFGLTEKRKQHKKIVKWTFPIWLYVAISGVLVYLLLSPYYTS